MPTYKKKGHDLTLFQGNIHEHNLLLLNFHEYIS